MTTILHVTFADDSEAAHFASMLKTDRGVIYKPHHATPDFDPDWEKLWNEPQSVKDVKLERKPEGKR